MTVEVRILDDDGERVVHPCPVCGGQVRADLTCHTYPQNGRWMACLPCDSAWAFCCATPDEDGDLLGEGCGWSYTWGLNPRNPRSVPNEDRWPPWIPEGAECPLPLSW